jgi:hypothetical protein
LGRESAPVVAQLSKSSLIVKSSRRGVYSPLPQHTLDAYDTELILEPDVELILKAEGGASDVDFVWTVSTSDDTTSMAGSFTFINSESKSLKGPELHMLFSPANANFVITCSSRSNDALNL